MTDRIIKTVLQGLRDITKLPQIYEFCFADGVNSADNYYLFYKDKPKGSATYWAEYDKKGKILQIEKEKGGKYRVVYDCEKAEKKQRSDYDKKV